MSNHTAKMSTRWQVECWRDGKIIWTEDVHNLVTTEGLNKILDATFKTGLTTPAWYVGLVNNASFSAFAAGDTLASHAGWLETTSYTGNRQAWTPGSISGGSVSNTASQAVFPITGTVTVHGGFLASVSSGSSGTLYGEAAFSVDRSVISGDTLNVTVTLSTTSA